MEVETPELNLTTNFFLNAKFNVVTTARLVDLKVTSSCPVAIDDSDEKQLVIDSHDEVKQVKIETPEEVKPVDEIKETPEVKQVDSHDDDEIQLVVEKNVSDAKDVTFDNQIKFVKSTEDPQQDTSDDEGSDIELTVKDDREEQQDAIHIKVNEPIDGERRSSIKQLDLGDLSDDEDDQEDKDKRSSTPVEEGTADVTIKDVSQIEVAQPAEKPITTVFINGTLKSAWKQESVLGKFIEDIEDGRPVWKKTEQTASGKSVYLYQLANTTANTTSDKKWRIGPDFNSQNCWLYITSKVHHPCLIMADQKRTGRVWHEHSGGEWSDIEELVITPVE